VRKRKQNLDESLFGIAFSDTLLSMLGVIFLVFAFIIMIPHNPETPSMQGQLCVEISWDNGRDVDLDLWGKSPAEKVAVGYSNMHGENLDLFRDCLGFNSNPTHQNMELMCAQKIVPGEWTFNVSYYGDHALPTGATDSPIDVTMVVRYKKVGVNSKSSASLITKTATYHLTKSGQEKTMFDFVIDKNGDIIENSINSMQHLLRDVK
jgi:hypothetical protein